MQSRTQWSVATRIFAAQVAALVLLSSVMTLLLWLDTRADVDRDAARVSLAVSTALAHDPFVIAAVQGDDPSSDLQPYAVSVMDSAHLDFITIMDTDGTRYTHRNEEEIGRTFLGSTDAALAGRSITETFTGTLGPSVRAVVPVEVDGEVVALVSAGVTVSNVAATLVPRLPFVFGAALLLVALGSLAAFVARRYLKRLTGSMQPSELTRMVGFYESVLHSTREGVVLVDDRHRVVLYNDEAADLLELPPATRNPQPVPVADLELPASIARLLESGDRAVEESHVAGDRVLLVNQEHAVPAGSAAGAVGTVMTLRDRTEVRRLSGELESVRTLTGALRSQTHEYANRLHTIVSLLELDRTRDAIDFIADEVRVSQSLTDDLMGAESNPALAALLLGKTAQARERGVEFTVSVGSELAASSVGPSELVSVVGNLIDNAFDAAAAGVPPAIVEVAISGDDGLEVRVSDSGRGVEPADERRIFDRGFSTKTGTTDHGFGLAVVREIVERHGGTVSLGQRGRTTFVVRFPA